MIVNQNNETKKWIEQRSAHGTSKKNKHSRKSHVKQSPTIVQSGIPEQQLSENDEFLKLKFPSTWNVWIHKNSSNGWKITDYNKIYSISSVHDLLSFVNNFNKLNYIELQFFVMKGEILPIWEDEPNRNGGTAVTNIKLPNNNLIKIWEDICLLTINQQICATPNEINGISFNLKNDMTVIKIWNKDWKNDISRIMSRMLSFNYGLRFSYRKHNY
jgi:hypothetical protein